MAYLSLPPNRYARRRRRIGIVALVAVIVGLLVAATWVRSEERSVSAYLEVARTVADGEVATAAGLNALLVDLGSLERPEAVDRITTLQQQVTEATAALAEAEVPAALGEVHGYLTVAAASWKEGIDVLEDGMLTILDSADDPRGEDLIGRSIETMRVGDRAYVGFGAALDRLEEGSVTSDFPRISFVEGADATLYNPTLMATRLRAFAALSERHDVAVTGTIEPTPVGERNDIPVVPLSDPFVVNVVVSNVGNLDEGSLVVRLELANVSATSASQVFEQTVGALQPGTSSTLTFTDLPVEPGVIYEVVVTVRVADDADPSNDRWSFVFLRNEES